MWDTTQTKTYSSWEEYLKEKERLFPISNVEDMVKKQGDDFKRLIEKIA